MFIKYLSMSLFCLGGEISELYMEINCSMEKNKTLVLSWDYQCHDNSFFGLLQETLHSFNASQRFHVSGLTTSLSDYTVLFIFALIMTAPV